MTRLKVLAIAAASGRVGYVLFMGDELKDWQLSEKASESPVNAAELAIALIETYRPDVVVTERLTEHTRKGARTQEIITAIAHVADHADCRHIQRTRHQTYANKYDEAEALVGRFPEMLDQMPKRPRIWQSEPKGTIYFEALSLALGYVDSQDT